MYVILNINQLNIRSTTQVLQKLQEGLISEGELIFYENPDIGFH